MRDTYRWQNMITAVYLLFLFTSVIMNVLNESINARLGFQSGWIQTAIHISLLIGWMRSVRTRLIQKGIRRHLYFMAVYLTFWIMLRALKFYVVAQYTDVSRWIWYLYYLPMMLYPVEALMSIRYIGERDSFVLSKRLYILYGAAALLAVLVLSNDLHELVFYFPDNGSIHTDFDYGHGPLFYAVFAWFMACTLMVFCCMLYRCRLPGGKKRIIYPLIPLILGLFYCMYYAAGHADMIPDLTVAMSFLTVFTFELAIRAGLIRSNSSYAELFNASTLSAEITDSSLTTVFAAAGSAGNAYREIRCKTADSSPAAFFAAGSTKQTDREILRKAVDGSTLVLGNTRICSSAIQGGYVFWQEDISNLQETVAELSGIQEELKSYGSLQEEENRQKKRRRRLEEQETIYDEIQSKTAPCLSTIAELSKQLKTADTAEQAKQLLWKITVTGAYLKRRSNLILLGHRAAAIPPEELDLCFRESLNQLRLQSDACGVRFGLKTPMPEENAASLYDFFETIVEQSLDHFSGVTVMLNERETDWGITVLLPCDRDLSFPEKQFPGAAAEWEEGTWFCTWSIAKGEPGSVHGALKKEVPCCDFFVQS